MSASPYQDRFSSSSRETASPRQLLILAYERVLRDLDDARSAIQEGRIEDRHTAICHAQELLSELAYALDGAAWADAPKMAALYSWCVTQLTNAQVRNDAEPLESVARILGELLAAWQVAADSTGPQLDMATSATRPALSVRV